MKKIAVSSVILVIAALPLMMAFSLRNVQAASTWKIETLDGPGYVGMWTSIALDSSGNPHIGYYSLQNYCLKYARWTGSTWSIETVDDTYASEVGEFLSLALDSGDNPHISYLDWSGTDGDLKYARWTGSEWSIETVPSPGDTGFFTSIALDSDDNPHISYLYRGRTPDLKYARWTGLEWSIETVDSPGGHYTSIALDSEGNPHISYHGPNPPSGGGDLKYARWTGSTWSIETADSIGATGWTTSLTLDSGDNPHISHYDNINLDLKYTWWTGYEWRTETVDSAGDVGLLPSLALDSGDNPHISYSDMTNSDLKYAWWSGSAWNIETVDSPDLVGRWSSIALDSDDNPHISYHYDTNGDLRYATVNGGNVAPVLGAIGPQTVDELVLLDFTATATDDDVPVQTLAFSVADGASGSVPSGASITSGGYFTWTPSESQGPGSYTFDVVVSDGMATDFETITVTVNEVNVAPVLDLISEYYVHWGEELTFTASAADEDLPANTLTFSLIGAPAGASITSGGFFSWTPSSSQIDEYTFTVKVEDDGSPLMYDEQQVTIDVGLASEPTVPEFPFSPILSTSLAFVALIIGKWKKFKFYPARARLLSSI